MAAIWVLAGAKTGDNLQVLRAADAMGLPYEVKRIVLKPGFETAKPKVTASLDIVDLTKSDALAGALARSRHHHRTAAVASRPVDQAAIGRLDEDRAVQCAQGPA